MEQSHVSRHWGDSNDKLRNFDWSSQEGKSHAETSRKGGVCVKNGILGNYPEAVNKVNGGQWRAIRRILQKCNTEEQDPR